MVSLAEDVQVDLGHQASDSPLTCKGRKGRAFLPGFRTKRRDPPRPAATLTFFLRAEVTDIEGGTKSCTRAGLGA